jgi:hypothetical protein
VDSAGQAAAAGFTVDKAGGNLATASSVKTRAVVTNTGKASGEQRRRPTRRDHNGGAVTYPTRTAARRGRARSSSVTSVRPDRSVLIPRTSTDEGRVVLARARRPDGRTSLTGGPDAGLSATDRWAARLKFSNTQITAEIEISQGKITKG